MLNYILSFIILRVHVMAARTEWSCYFHIAQDLHHPAGSLHDRLSNPRSTKEPFKTKFQPSSVSTSRIPSSTCMLFFKVHTRYISLSFYIICALEFYRRVAWLLICSWTSSLYTGREFWFAQLGPSINHLSRQTNPHPRFWHKALTVFVQSVKNFTFSGGFFFPQDLLWTIHNAVCLL